MARHPLGWEVLKIAQEKMAQVKDADDLRLLQAVIFPLANGMSTAETSAAIGRSTRWTTKARNSFIQNGGIITRAIKGGRKRANMSLEEESAFLQPFFESARQGGVLVVSVIHQALEGRLGRKVALASAYNLLHRHGWRKLAPDKRNVATDAAAQEEWKKNFHSVSRTSDKAGTNPEQSG
jgi:transposase